MVLSMQELKEIASLIRAEERISVDITGGAITLSVKARPDDTLYKPLSVEIGENSVKISRLGVYELGKYKVWVVKE